MLILLNNYNDFQKYQLPREFPDNLLNEDWASEIHGQTLERLNSRGGMCPCELIGNIKKLSFKKICEYSEEKAISELKQLIH